MSSTENQTVVQEAANAGFAAKTENSCDRTLAGPFIRPLPLHQPFMGARIPVAASVDCGGAEGEAGSGDDTHSNTQSGTLNALSATSPLDRDGGSRTARDAAMTESVNTVSNNSINVVSDAARAVLLRTKLQGTLDALHATQRSMRAALAVPPAPGAIAAAAPAPPSTLTSTAGGGPAQLWGPGAAAHLPLVGCPPRSLEDLGDDLYAAALAVQQLSRELAERATAPPAASAPRAPPPPSVMNVFRGGPLDGKAAKGGVPLKTALRNRANSSRAVSSAPADDAGDCALADSTFGTFVDTLRGLDADELAGAGDTCSSRGADSACRPAARRVPSGTSHSFDITKCNYNWGGGGGGGGPYGAVPLPPPVSHFGGGAGAVLRAPGARPPAAADTDDLDGTFGMLVATADNISVARALEEEEEAPEHATAAPGTRPPAFRPVAFAASEDDEESEAEDDSGDDNYASVLGQLVSSLSATARNAAAGDSPRSGDELQEGEEMVHTIAGRMRVRSDLYGSLLRSSDDADSAADARREP